MPERITKWVPFEQVRKQEALRLRPMNKEHVKEVKESIAIFGQKNPIDVLEENPDEYCLSLDGYTRYEAIRQLRKDPKYSNLEILVSYVQHTPEEKRVIHAVMSWVIDNPSGVVEFLKSIFKEV